MVLGRVITRMDQPYLEIHMQFPYYFDSSVNQTVFMTAWVIWYNADCGADV